MTTYQLYMFAKEDIHGISFEYLTANDWQIEAIILKERFSNAKTIPVPKNFIALNHYPQMNLKLRSTS